MIEERIEQALREAYAHGYGDGNGRYPSREHEVARQLREALPDLSSKNDSG